MKGIIAAISLDRIIGAYSKKGKKGYIPWTARGDQTLFKDITMGHTVVMGRNTHESIGHVLHGRKNIIVSGTMEVPSDDIIVVPSIKAALAESGDNTWFIGGREIFREAMSLVDEIKLTVIPSTVRNHLPKGARAVLFPAVDNSLFDMSSETHPYNSKLLLITYRRKKNG